MKIQYQSHRFGDRSLKIIAQADEIIDTYVAQGYKLTLRQLYYQFVSRAFIQNSVAEYKRLGSIVNDARLAGLIDWESIEDRTRELKDQPHWASPASIIGSAAEAYAIDKWADQENYVEVWIEKEALAGVFERVCESLDVSFLSCRGYTSQSEMWAAAERLKRQKRRGHNIHILHFGDHDPSGIDMTRDIQDRLNVFGCGVELVRVALNMDQVQKYEPPPNPAKETDSRFVGYLRSYGDQSWELDALEPQILADLARAHIETLRDDARFQSALHTEAEEKKSLKEAAERWVEVQDFLES